jgi:hypothetical protein
LAALRHRQLGLVDRLLGLGSYCMGHVP